MEGQRIVDYLRQLCLDIDAGLPLSPYLWRAVTPLALPAAMALGVAGCGDSQPIQLPLAREVCTDNADNDGDGLVDCLDSDCAGDSSCPTTVYGAPFGTKQPSPPPSPDQVPLYGPPFPNQVNPDDRPSPEPLPTPEYAAPLDEPPPPPEPLPTPEYAAVFPANPPPSRPLPIPREPPSVPEYAAPMPVAEYAAPSPRR